MKRKADEGAALGGLLAKAGASLDVAGVDALIRGIIAAPPPPPPGHAVDAWTRLVVADPDETLVRALVERKRLIEATADDGLDGRPTRPERLRALRAELSRRGLDGFIVPRSDEHQGEYVARRSERLAWLTGFTGSAGVAVVLKDKAAIFVDGRYTLQAKAEVLESVFRHCHMADRPPIDWIAEALPAGGKLGYDPWLMTPNQLSRLRAACKRAGGELAATDRNPLDAVWTGQPAPPISPAVPHADGFAGAPAADKRRRIADGLAEDKLDAALLTAPDSIAWLLNVRGGDVPFTPLTLSFAVIHADAGVDLFIDPMKLAPGTRDHLGPEVRVAGPDAFGPALDALGRDKKTVRVNADTAPAWAWARLEAAGARIDGGDDPCQLPKARKTPAQLQGIRAAHKRDGAALTRFLAWLAREAPKGTVTETAAADRLEALRRANDNFRGLSFPTISGAGPHGAVVHYRVTAETDSRLEPGTLYLVDSGAQYLDGTTDVTRTVAIGRPTDEMRGAFTRVLKGHIALATQRFPAGTAGSQLDALARQALWQAGLDYDHGTGHGVGHYLGVHEGPQRISKLPSQVALE
ncbi:MAG TPA: M24B family metallopeptidase, partial [Rhodospirillales bacterium]